MKRRNNKSFGRMRNIGTRNPLNRVSPIVSNSSHVEVSLTQDRSHAAIELELLVPIQRSECGSRRVAALKLNGRQARSLYETLEGFFANKT